MAGLGAVARLARWLLLKRDMAMLSHKKRQRQTREQKLLDALTQAVACLKEAGDPLRGPGPSQHYAEAFKHYGEALKNLLVLDCPLHVADWGWDGYEGTFNFYWEFGAQLVQPGSTYDHDTRFVAMRCAALFDPRTPLEEELARLRAEARHYDGLRVETMRWAYGTRDRSLARLESAS